MGRVGGISVWVYRRLEYEVMGNEGTSVQYVWEVSV